MKEINYQIIRSSRKSLVIQIKPDGKVVVRAPLGLSTEMIEAFVSVKKDWIVKQLAKQPEELQKLSATEVHDMACHAKEVIPKIAAHYAPLVGVTYGKITIRNQRTRWGSCSNKGNLNFNCLLMLAPNDVINYVVVHELCHRKEMNHSARFWAEVERVLPNYKESKRWLRDNGSQLIGRLQ